MARLLSLGLIRLFSSSILISVPPYFEISTLSPFFTVKSIFLPLSSIFPVPKATTFPSCGFSLAVSGMMIPPFFISCSSSGCTSTRSPRGLTLTAAIGLRYSLVCFLGYAGGPENVGTVDKLLSAKCARHRRLLLLVLVHHFELRIDDVAAVAFTCACALFRAAAWLRFGPGLRPWTRTGLR